MLRWLYKFLMNRRNIAGDLPSGTLCGIPGCDSPAKDQWCPSTCALREAGVEAVWVPVCAEHDVQSNEATVRFFFGQKYDEELAAYRARRIR